MSSRDAGKGQKDAPVLDQIGVVVRSIDRAMPFFEDVLGVGPFRVMEPDYVDRTYRGKPGHFRIRVALAELGKVQLELIQPLYGETIYDEFLERKGEGLHHLAFRVANMEEKIAEWGEKGIGVLQSGRRPGVRWAYLDTEAVCGMIVEFIQRGE